MACVLYHLYRHANVLHALSYSATDGVGGLKVKTAEIGHHLYERSSSNCPLK